MATEGMEDDDNIEPSAAIERIFQLQAERERKREDTNKLEQKLKALNNELAARIEELDRCRRELDEEQKRNKQAASERREQGNAGGGQLQTVAPGSAEEKDRQKEKVRHFIEEALQGIMRPEPAPNALGIRTFDEKDLMVQQHSNMEGDQLVDTVLVTYLKPNSEERYYLSFRIGKDTTVKNLKDDACSFWNESQVEYILTTTDNSKCHDDLLLQKCFRRIGGRFPEAAELFLQKKDTKRVTLTASENAEIKERKLPNRTKKKHNMQEVAQRAGPESLEDSMKQLPGLYAYMTQRDRNVLTHLTRIKLRSLCVVFILILLTFASVFHLRTSNTEFFVRRGVEKALTHQVYYEPLNKWITDFHEIDSREEVFDWLQYKLPTEVFTNTSQLRAQNYVPGWIQIRMQHVRSSRNSYCTHIADIPAATRCSDEEYDTNSQGTEPFETIKTYWEGCTNCTGDGTNVTGVAGTSGRGGQPWKFHDNDWGTVAEMREERGYYQWYDSSGYIVQYDMQHRHETDAAVIDAYQADLSYLESQDWVSARTRALHVNLDLFNGNMDYWLSCWFLIEFPAAGIVRPSAEVLIFSPLAHQQSLGYGLVQLLIDLTRFVGILYMSCYTPYMEIQWERGRKHSIWSYLCASMGFTDLACGALFVAIFVVRFFVIGMWGQDHDDLWLNVATEFWSMRNAALLWRTHTVLEGFLLMGLFFRLCTYLRINRHFYVLWETLREAGKAGWLFVLIFLPVFFGFTAVMHFLLGPYSELYKDFHMSITATIMTLMNGPFPLEVISSYSWYYKYKIAFELCFHLLTTLIFINSWVALILSEYQRCRVMYGYNPKHYAWAEYQYVNWCLWKPFQKIYVRALRLGRVQFPPDETMNDEDSLL